MKADAEKYHHVQMLAHLHIYTSNQPRKTSTFVGIIQIFFAKHQAMALNSSRVKLKTKNHITSSWLVFFVITLHLERATFYVRKYFLTIRTKCVYILVANWSSTTQFIVDTSDVGRSKVCIIQSFKITRPKDGCRYVKNNNHYFHYYQSPTSRL